MFETVLLLATCAGIVYSAADRLMHGKIDIEVNIWSFAVMATSIVVDWSRSRMLRKAAKEHNSQALEADALHFSTDIWSSAVVIAGLACVKASEFYPSLAFLKSADAAAAIVVAVIVFHICGELGMRTIHALLDAAPDGLEEQIRSAVEALPVTTPSASWAWVPPMRRTNRSMGRIRRLAARQANPLPKSTSPSLVYSTHWRPTPHLSPSLRASPANSAGLPIPPRPPRRCSPSFRDSNRRLPAQPSSGFFQPWWSPWRISPFRLAIRSTSPATKSPRMRRNLPLSSAKPTPNPRRPHLAHACV